MSVIISHGSQRFNTREQTKFYGPWVNIGGKVLRLKRLHATATGAKEYAARFAKRYPGFVQLAEAWAVRERKETMTVFSFLLQLLSILLKHGNLKVKVNGSGLNWELKKDDISVGDDLHKEGAVLWVDVDR